MIKLSGYNDLRKNECFLRHLAYNPLPSTLLSPCRVLDCGETEVAAWPSRNLCFPHDCARSRGRRVRRANPFKGRDLIQNQRLPNEGRTVVVVFCRGERERPIKISPPACPYERLQSACEGRHCHRSFQKSTSEVPLYCCFDILCVCVLDLSTPQYFMPTEILPPTQFLLSYRLHTGYTPFSLPLPSRRHLWHSLISE